MTAYDPWLALATFPDWKLLRSDMLPRDTYGYTNWKAHEITLALGMTPGEDRATLTHELIHLERGNVQHPLCFRVRDVETAIEEALVELLVAARLLPSAILPRLQDMVAQSDVDLVGEALNVDGLVVDSGIKLAALLDVVEPQAALTPADLARSV